MSRKGKCWDNAEMERVWRQDYDNHSEASNDVTDYIVPSTTTSSCIALWEICLPMSLKKKW
jgi:hypothetical protein